MAGVIAPRLIGADADIDGNARGAQPGVALPCHFGIGVFERRHHARNAGGNDGVGAGRRFAVMRAGLERDIQCRANCRLTRAAQRLDLGMRPAAGLRPAAADNHAILDDDRADRRIGPGAAKPAPAEAQSQRHETLSSRCANDQSRDKLECMNIALRRAMTVEEYLAWSESQSERQRTELINGQVVAKAMERLAHNRVKGQVYLALRQAVAAAKLPCEVMTDGLAVRIDDHTLMNRMPWFLAVQACRVRRWSCPTP